MQKLLWGTAQMGLNLLPAQAAAFDIFTEELLAWNERTNLTAITDPDQVEIRHYLDSLALVPALAALDGISPAALLGRGVRAIDVGAGAGLPGLALLCAGEMSMAAVKGYDPMAWFPGAGKWMELSSCSNCGDWQARRAGVGTSARLGHVNTSPDSR